MAGRYIIIVGCGRLGSILANQLSKDGHSVVVIDRDANAFRKLSADFSGYRIHSNTVEIAALREAKIDRADCLLATTDQDNVNMMVAQIARSIFHVPVVLARVPFHLGHEAVEAAGVTGKNGSCKSEIYTLCQYSSVRSLKNGEGSCLS